MAAESSVARPPIDPSLNIELPEIVKTDRLDVARVRESAKAMPTADSVLRAHPNYIHTEHAAQSTSNDDESVLLSVFSPRSPSSDSLPCLYSVHFGGQVAGNRFDGLAELIAYCGDHQVILIAPEYRLAPEHQASAGAMDCYTGLTWAVKHSADLGIDTDRVIVCGESGGGPLAAATVLLSRDNHHPKIRAQMLLTPMLDDCVNTVSARQFERGVPWCGLTNRDAWSMVLGERRGGPDVRDLEAPARAKNLSDLPATYIEVGECEVFRDEAVAFASKMWECGSTAELHVWPGAYHGFDRFVPTSALTKIAWETKKAWMKRMLST